jgi:uncharacterized membrane protein YgdD (TMEM256/DUF423 family)
VTKFLSVAGLHGAMAVGFGAFAAHGAEKVLSGPAIDWLKTGSQYQLVHAVALLGIAAFLAARGPVRLVTASGLAFALGALLFSGSLYLLAWDGSRLLVYLTPLGGALLILGWLLLFIAGFKKDRL